MKCIWSCHDFHFSSLKSLPLKALAVQCSLPVILDLTFHTLSCLIVLFFSHVSVGWRCSHCLSLSVRDHGEGELTQILGTVAKPPRCVVEDQNRVLRFEGEFEAVIREGGLTSTAGITYVIRHLPQSSLGRTEHAVSNICSRDCGFHVYLSCIIIVSHCQPHACHNCRSLRESNHL